MRITVCTGVETLDLRALWGSRCVETSATAQYTTAIVAVAIAAIMANIITTAIVVITLRIGAINALRSAVHGFPVHLVFHDSIDVVVAVRVVVQEDVGRHCVRRDTVHL